MLGDTEASVTARNSPMHRVSLRVVFLIPFPDILQPPMISPVERNRFSPDSFQIMRPSSLGCRSSGAASALRQLHNALDDFGKESFA